VGGGQKEELGPPRQNPSFWGKKESTICGGGWKEAAWEYWRSAKYSRAGLLIEWLSDRLCSVKKHHHKIVFRLAQFEAGIEKP